MTDFIPETPKASQDVPYFDDVTSAGGWQGHETSKSIDRLKAEVSDALQRLGAIILDFRRGQFVVGERQRGGFRITYVVERQDGSMVRGRLDIAALPVKTSYALRKSEKTRQEKALKMALYMVKMALDGAWFLQQLSPGYAPLMPWMLASENKTVSQLWAESDTMRNLLPPGESDFEEGEYREVG